MPELLPIIRAVEACQEVIARPILVALDGRSGAGKSTLAVELAAALCAALISGDDFYAGGGEEEWRARSSSERRAQTCDWERLRSDALVPLLSRRRATWRPFDWATMQGLSAEQREQVSRPVILLDMVYSSGPELQDLVDLAVLVMLDDAERRARIAARDGGDWAARWTELWESAEDLFSSELCDPRKASTSWLTVRRRRRGCLREHHR